MKDPARMQPTILVVEDEESISQPFAEALVEIEDLSRPRPITVRSSDPVIAIGKVETKSTAPSMIVSAWPSEAFEEAAMLKSGVPMLEPLSGHSAKKPGTQKVVAEAGPAKAAIRKAAPKSAAANLERTFIATPILEIEPPGGGEGYSPAAA